MDIIIKLTLYQCNLFNCKKLQIKEVDINIYSKNMTCNMYNFNLADGFLLLFDYFYYKFIEYIIIMTIILRHIKLSLYKTKFMALVK